MGVKTGHRVFSGVEGAFSFRGIEVVGGSQNGIAGCSEGA